MIYVIFFLPLVFLHSLIQASYKKPFGFSAMNHYCFHSLPFVTLGHHPCRTSLVELYGRIQGENSLYVTQAENPTQPVKPFDSTVHSVISIYIMFLLCPFLEKLLFLSSMVDWLVFSTHFVFMYCPRLPAWLPVVL